MIIPVTRTNNDPTTMFRKIIAPRKNEKSTANQDKTRLNASMNTVVPSQ
jgi:hypothetical protein